MVCQLGKCLKSIVSWCIIILLLLGGSQALFLILLTCFHFSFCGSIISRPGHFFSLSFTFVTHQYYILSIKLGYEAIWCCIHGESWPIPRHGCAIFHRQHSLYSLSSCSKSVSQSLFWMLAEQLRFKHQCQLTKHLIRQSASHLRRWRIRQFAIVLFRLSLAEISIVHSGNIL